VSLFVLFLRSTIGLLRRCIVPKISHLYTLIIYNYNNIIMSCCRFLDVVGRHETLRLHVSIILDRILIIGHGV
jgi:hypothetical protein